MEKSSKMLLALFVIFILAVAVFMVIIKKCNVDFTSSCKMSSLVSQKIDSATSSTKNANETNIDNVNMSNPQMPTSSEVEKISEHTISGLIKEIKDNKLVLSLDTADYDDIKVPTHNFVILNDVKIFQETVTEGQEEEAKEISKSSLQVGDSVTIEFNDKEEVSSIVKVVGDENGGSGWTEIE